MNPFDVSQKMKKKYKKSYLPTIPKTNLAKFDLYIDRQNLINKYLGCALCQVIIWKAWYLAYEFKLWRHYFKCCTLCFLSKFKQLITLNVIFCRENNIIYILLVNAIMCLILIKKHKVQQIKNCTSACLYI